MGEAADCSFRLQIVSGDPVGVAPSAIRNRAKRTDRRPVFADLALAAPVQRLMAITADAFEICRVNRVRLA